MIKSFVVSKMPVYLGIESDLSAGGSLNVKDIVKENALFGLQRRLLCRVKKLTISLQPNKAFFIGEK